MGKKWWLLVGAGAVVMAFWIVRVSSAPWRTPEEPTAQTQASEELEFPCVLGDCGLVAETLINYEGLFREDGSNRPVSGVAGLIVYNPGQQQAELAELVVYQKERILCFKVTHLPADSRCLVLESGAQAYSSEPISICTYRDVRWDDRMREIPILVEKGGRAVENPTDAAVNIELYYKLYLPSQRLYLGGITYCMQVQDLQPGEKRELPFPDLGIGNVVTIR